jgi:carbohydrate diacid regulator
MGIKDKTGINLSVYGTDGVFIDGEEGLEKVLTVSVNGVTCDSKSKRTIFPFKYKNKSYLGSVKGSGNAEKNYAYFIGELASNYSVKEADMSRGEFSNAVLFGEINYSQIDYYMKKFAIKDSSVFVMVISTTEQALGDVVKILTNYTADSIDFVSEIDQKQVAFVKFISDENSDYQSTTEYAEFMQQSLFEEIGAPIRISIGGIVDSFAELNYSFTQAISCAKMSEEFGGNTQVHTFKEYILIKMLEDIPKNKLNEYLELLTDIDEKEIFADKEMTITAEEFLDSSLNVSETARKLYLHRNTLIYRLDKIEKETGLNIRKFSDAITFRLITILSKLAR